MRGPDASRMNTHPLGNFHVTVLVRPHSQNHPTQQWNVLYLFQRNSGRIKSYLGIDDMIGEQVVKKDLSQYRGSFFRPMNC